jgi:AraC-like DNA-binding protein
MMNTIQNPYLAFTRHKIRRPRFSEQITIDNKLAHVVAQPLFDAGIHIAAITERADYADTGYAVRNYHELRLLLQGKMTVVMRDQAYHLIPGDLVVCPARTPIHYEARHTPSWWLYFQIETLPKWQAFSKSPGHVNPYGAAPLMFLLLRDILDALASHDPGAMRQASASAKMLAELISLAMLSGNVKASSQGPSLQELVMAITRAPSEKWDLKSMTTFLHLSSSQVTRLFRSELGLTPKELVVRQRMKTAVDLLVNSDLKIEYIAARSGYQSLHSFTRLFHHHVGLPPGEYRARFGLASK